MKTCYPLNYVKQDKIIYTPWEEIISSFLQMVNPTINFNAQEFHDFMYSKEYLNQFSTNKYADFRNMLWSNNTLLQQLTGIDYSGCNQSLIITEWKDFLTIPIVLGEWQENKQIYHLDCNFASELLKTEESELHLSILKKITNRTFYIDFSDCVEFKPFVGCFVHLHIYDNQFSISEYILSEKLVLYSSYLSGTAGEDGFLKVRLNSFCNYDFKTFEEQNKEEMQEANESSISYGKINMLVVQTLMYIASKNPDIVENEETKRTYRKTESVRNKFSEIQQWEVGTKFGKAIRRFKREFNSQTNESVNSKRSRSESLQKVSAFSSASHKTHSSPIPHVRAAHWHHYWVGKGRTELIVKWLPPTFVNSNGVILDIMDDKYNSNCRIEEGENLG